MSQFEWIECAGREALATCAAEAVTATLGDALRRQGSASAAFPGGATPLPIYDLIAAAPLNWPRVSLLLTDERIVAADDPLRNQTKLAAAFGATGARVIDLIGDTLDAASALARASKSLRALPPPLDLVWLGVGGDGHTASLFPGPDLEAALSRDPLVRVVAVRPDPMPPEAPAPRISLSLEAIATARRVLITITGAAKRRLLEEAALQTDRYVIGRVLAACEARPTIFYAD